MKKSVYLTLTPNNTYRVRYIDANGKWWSKTFKTKTETQIFERAVKMDEPLKEWFPGEANTQGNTFRDLAMQWLEHAEHVREISGSCLMTYRGHLRNHILPVIGNVRASELNVMHIEGLAKVLTKKKPQSRSYTAIRNSWDSEFFEGDEFLSVSYRREILIIACMIGKWASERDLVVKHPFERFQLPEKPEQPYDYWRLEDEDAFFDWLENGGVYYLPVRAPIGGRVFSKPMRVRDAEELRDVVLFALRSGMRLGEIGALCNRDVNLAEGWVRIRASYSSKEGKMKKTTKNGKYRMIEMNEDMRRILEKRRHIHESKPIFNIQMNTIKFFSRTCRWAGVREIHFHALRHTCLTNLANGYGMDRPLPISQVQQIAGHSDLKMTQRYVHVSGVKDTGSVQWSREERMRRKGAVNCGTEIGSMGSPTLHSLSARLLGMTEATIALPTTLGAIKKPQLVVITNQG